MQPVSDGHKGHVGSNGLTAVFAKELTRGATPSVFIFSARAFVPPAILKHIKGAI